MFFHTHPRPRTPRLPQAKPQLEILESRIVPYANSGNAWINPQLITISFVPDGTVLGTSNGHNITSNLFATFDKIRGVTLASQWENLILQAAQTWAASANVNFELVPDDGSNSGSGLYQQGAPNFGDIRIGGYNFSNSWLGSTYYPAPATNYSLAGDINFNTGQSFNIGSTYDLFTVAAHEFGHALGLGESTSTTAVMFSPYNGARRALGTDDVNGIHAIYGARPADGSNNSFATATDVSSSIDPVLLTGVVNNLNITSTSASDYYTFTAPLLTTSNMTISVQSTGLSLFTPSVTVYAADQQTILGSNTFQLASGALEDGATLSVTVSGVTAGTQYYVVVQGADSSVFSTGAYALTLNFGILPNPTAPSPYTTVLNGSPLKNSGGQADVGGFASGVAAGDANLVHGIITPAVSGNSVLAAPAMPLGPGAILAPVGTTLLAGSASVRTGEPVDTQEQPDSPAAAGQDGQNDTGPVVPSPAADRVDVVLRRVAGGLGRCQPRLAGGRRTRLGTHPGRDHRGRMGPLRRPGHRVPDLRRHLAPLARRTQGRGGTASRGACSPQAPGAVNVVNLPRGPRVNPRGPRHFRFGLPRRQGDAIRRAAGSLFPPRRHPAPPLLVMEDSRHVGSLPKRVCLPGERYARHHRGLGLIPAA